MSNVAPDVVQFYRGPADSLPPSGQRSSDSLYFTTDTHRIYLGQHQYAEYLAGDGISITNDTISVKALQPGDITDIVIPPDPKTIDLDDIEDVAITSAQQGQSLVYDATNQSWVNGFSRPQWETF